MEVLKRLIASRTKLLKQFSGPQKLMAMVLLIAELVFALILLTQDCRQALIAYIVTWMGIIVLAGFYLLYASNRESGARSHRRRAATRQTYDNKDQIEFLKTLHRFYRDIIGLSRGGKVKSLQSGGADELENSPLVSERPRNESEDESS